MKPLLFIFLLLLVQTVQAQSLDYISVRKPNGRVVKNFYAGSHLLLQLTDGSYLEGPVQAVRNDSVFITLYDIRYLRTTFGSIIRDTVSTSIASFSYKEVSRIYLDERKGFFRRMAGPLLIIGGAGYLTLNVLNGAFYDLPITDAKNLRRLGTAVGAVGLGILFQKLFASDGFTKKKHQITYVDL